MEGPNPQENANTEDPWSNKNGPDSMNNSKEEESEIKAAMMNWKKKGNTRLADACAEALELREEITKKWILNERFLLLIIMKVCTHRW